MKKCNGTGLVLKICETKNNVWKRYELSILSGIDNCIEITKIKLDSASLNKKLSQGTPHYPVKGKNDYPDSNRDHTAAYLCCCSFWLLLPRLIRCCPPVIWVHKSRTSTAMIYRQRPCHCVCLRTVNLKAENTAKH